MEGFDFLEGVSYPPILAFKPVIECRTMAHSTWTYPSRTR
jgi:hypothetical protein